MKRKRREKWRFAQDIPIGDADNNTGYFQPWHDSRMRGFSTRSRFWAGERYPEYYALRVTTCVPLCASRKSRWQIGVYSAVQRIYCRSGTKNYDRRRLTCKFMTLFHYAPIFFFFFFHPIRILICFWKFLEENVRYVCSKKMYIYISIVRTREQYRTLARPFAF